MYKLPAHTNHKARLNFNDRKTNHFIIFRVATVRSFDLRDMTRNVVKKLYDLGLTHPRRRRWSQELQRGKISFVYQELNIYESSLMTHLPRMRLPRPSKKNPSADVSSFFFFFFSSVHTIRNPASVAASSQNNALIKRRCFTDSFSRHFLSHSNLLINTLERQRWFKIRLL